MASTTQRFVGSKQPQTVHTATLISMLDATTSLLRSREKATKGQEKRRFCALSQEVTFWTDVGWQF